MLNVAEYIKEHIRTVPDWPQQGVMFRDITPLLQDPKMFRVLIDVFVHRYMNELNMAWQLFRRCRTNCH